MFNYYNMTCVKRIIIIIILTIFIYNNECANIEKTKNVLLLLADDAGFEMGAYRNRFCQTPNLDALAKKSLIFNNAFTSVSSCSPSRAQLLTGQPSHQNGMYGLHQGVHHFNVFNTISSLPNILNDHNILTGLIGKKHVGPKEQIKFSYEQTEEIHSINQIGRNITNIKLYVRKFLEIAKNQSKSFFLMIGFHDPHRCGHISPQFGQFCERWGSGEIGMGKIPDWTPIYYDWRNLNVPDYLPNTDNVRKELAAQYMTISRLDQGIGLIINELKNFNYDDNTLIIYSSDNGPPFPGGRTNMYDPGVRVPLLIYSPELNVRRNEVTTTMSSLLDIFPSILEQFHIDTNCNTTGKSLLPLLKYEPKPNTTDAIYGSQNYHEITMNYPMRMIRTRRFKLIHNINNKSFFPIDQDLYTSDTFQEILNATIAKKKLPWYKNLQKYYKREEWELYDLKFDPLEQWNLVNKAKFQTLKADLQDRLTNWQIKTQDPWRCAPHQVLENAGVYKSKPVCMPLYHELFN